MESNNKIKPIVFVTQDNKLKIIESIGTLCDAREPEVFVEQDNKLKTIVGIGTTCDTREL